MEGMTQIETLGETSTGAAKRERGVVRSRKEAADVKWNGKIPSPKQLTH